MDVKRFGISPRNKPGSTRWFAGFCTTCLLVLPAPRAVPAEPKGDDRIKSIRMLEIPGEPVVSKVSRAILTDDSFYIAGHSWTEETGEDLWLWRVDRAGKKLWEKKIHAQGRDSLEVLALLAPSTANAKPTDSEGVKLMMARNSQPVAILVRPDGEFLPEVKIEKLDGATGALAVGKDEVLLFGTGRYAKDKQPDVWIARCDATSALLWKQVFPLGTAAEQVPEAPKGTIRNAFLLSAGVLGDGSIVLVGQAGAFSKFGTGLSKLHLLRINQVGEKLSQSTIDNALIFPSARDLIAPCDDGVLITYTFIDPLELKKEQGPPKFDARAARFDSNLKKVWDKPVPGFSMFTTATITGPAPYITVVADMMEKAIVIRGLSDSGEQVLQARVSELAGMAFPVQTLRADGNAIVVCGYNSFGIVDGKREPSQVLLIEVDTKPDAPSQ